MKWGMYICHTVFTVQLLGNIWAWRLYTPVPKHIAKGIVFVMYHQNFSFIDSFKIESWYPLICIFFKFIRELVKLQKLSLSLQTFNFFSFSFSKLFCFITCKFCFIPLYQYQLKNFTLSAKIWNLRIHCNLSIFWKQVALSLLQWWSF